MSRFDFNYPPFDSLSPAEQQLLEEQTDIAFYPDEAIIIGPDQRIDTLYVVIKGVVREEAGDEVIARYQQHDSFDARAMVAGQSTHRFIAEEEALLYVLPRATLMTLTERNPRFGAYFYASVSEKLGTLARREGSRELQTLLTATIRDVACRVPVFVDGNDSIRDVAAIMKQHKTKSVLVREQDRLGIFTTTDFRDIILHDIPGSSRVGDHCQFQLLTIDSNDFLFNALLLMTRRNLRRLVVTEQGLPVGILAQVDVLSYFSNHSHLIAQQLERATSLDGLQAIAAQITRLIQILSGHGVKPLQLGRLVQTLNARLFQRAWQLIAPEELINNSCLLVMGSEGRGEQILKTDQDNALILRDGHTHSQLQDICLQFSSALASFGYPPCPGNIMLSNSEWCLSSSSLHDRIYSWIHQPDGDALMQLAIFLDSEAICGDTSLLYKARQFMSSHLQDNDGFYARFARAIEQFGTPLGLFSHLQTREQDGKDLLDLKKGGIFPLVHGIRALALEYDLTETNSQQRAQRLAELGHLDSGMANDIGEALSFLLELRLNHGLARLESGKSPDNLIEPAKLTTLERDLLKDALAVVKKFKSTLRHHYRLGNF